MNKRERLSLYRDLPKRHIVRCEHCGEPFIASTARIKRGPVVCFPCRWMIFEQSSWYGHRRENKIGKLNKPKKYHGRSYTKKRLAEFSI